MRMFELDFCQVFPFDLVKPVKNQLFFMAFFNVYRSGRVLLFRTIFS